MKKPRCTVILSSGRRCKRSSRHGCTHCWQHYHKSRLALEPSFDCCICMNDKTSRWTMAVGPCGHRLHAHCLNKLLESKPHATCPLCRGPIDVPLSFLHRAFYNPIVCRITHTITKLAKIRDGVARMRYVCEIFKEFFSERWLAEETTSFTMWLHERLAAFRKEYDHEQWFCQRMIFIKDELSHS
jgi:hypothetical protein